jgi:hypothetical protein
MKQNQSAVLLDESLFDPDAMLAVVRKLSFILAEESSLLKDMKITKIHKFYNDKIELTAILENYKAILIQNPQLLNGFSKRTLQQIRDEMSKFDVLVTENTKEIIRAKEVHRLVMEALRKTLEKNTVKSIGYNKKGLISTESNGVYFTPPVSINEDI